MGSFQNNHQRFTSGELARYSLASLHFRFDYGGVYGIAGRHIGLSTLSAGCS